MDPLVKFYLLVGCVIILAVLLNYSSSLRARKRERRRGTFSERNCVSSIIGSGIPSSNVFYDLYVQNGMKWYTQVDALAVTDVGIIVFEVKDYSGWIFGKGTQGSWCQTFRHSKNHFYNPILQNNRHIEVLRKKLRLIADVPFYSVVVFYGSCVFKNVSEIPFDTSLIYSSQLPSTIQGILRSNAPCRYQNMPALLSYLQQCQENGNDQKIVTQHIRNIRSEFGGRY